MTPTDFEDRSLVVTGAGSGIGRAVAAAAHQRGARVAAIDIDVSHLPDGVLGLEADVTDEEGVRAAVDGAARHLGGINILINNAGIGAQGTVADNSLVEWQRVFDVNVFGIVRVTQAALPYLRKSSNPVIVNTSSVAATTGLPNRALYSATKGAVQSLTLAMAADFVREGIRVNCVNPGTTDTPWVQRLLQSAGNPVVERRALEARQPIGRLVSATEVASAILYLASSDASATTGTVLAVDGGMASVRLPLRESQ